MGSQTQEAGTESWIIDDTLLVVFAIVFISRKTVYCFALLKMKLVNEYE